MGLPWVRFDTNTPNHDKILALIADPSPKRWQALSSWAMSIMWSGGAGTDGRIPEYALSAVHGTPTTARLLVKYRLWAEATGAWEIVNFDQRQELHIVAEAKQAARAASGRKAACVRHHGQACGCWKVAKDA